jgi:hypothetical protein
METFAAAAAVSVNGVGHSGMGMVHGMENHHVGSLHAELEQSPESVESALGVSDPNSIGSDPWATLQKTGAAADEAAADAAAVDADDTDAAAAAVDDVEAHIAASLIPGGAKKRKRNHEDEESIRAVCQSWDSIKDDESWHKQKLVELLAARTNNISAIQEAAQSTPIYTTSAIDAAAMAHQPSHEMHQMIDQAQLAQGLDENGAMPVLANTNEAAVLQGAEPLAYPPMAQAVPGLPGATPSVLL